MPKRVITRLVGAHRAAAVGCHRFHSPVKRFCGVFRYEKLVSYWIGEKYTLRYTGGMVPDVFQIIVKEKGVFSNVTSPSTKAKLRILFEVAPLGLLVRHPLLTTLRLVVCILRICR